MKTFIFLFIAAFLVSTNAKAFEKVKVAVIISLDDKEGKAFYNSSHYDVNQRIEKEFKKYFDPETFEIVVIKNATLSSVWETLHDISFQGVFFLGHAGSVSNDNSVTSPSIIADQNMYNIKNAFQSVHANLRYLAFISCNAQGIIQKFIDQKYYANAPELYIKSFDKKVELESGIRELVFDEKNPLIEHQSYDELFPLGGPCDPYNFQSDADLAACKERAIKMKAQKANLKILDKTYTDKTINFNFQIERAIPSDAKGENVQPTLIMAQERVVGFFGNAMPGEHQVIKVNLTNEELKGKVSIVNDSGAPSSKIKNMVALGVLDMRAMTPKTSCEFKGIQNSKGELLGVGKNIYDLRCGKK
jgi:hypothetical protein